MASCPRLRPTTMLQAGRSSLPQRLLQADHYSLPLRVLQAELFYFETKKIGVGRSSLLRPGQAPHDYAAGGPFYFATKKIGVGRGAVATTTAAGGTVLLCRHDGAALILDFKPRLANRCKVSHAEFVLSTMSASDSNLCCAEKNGPPAAVVAATSFPVGSNG